MKGFKVDYSKIKSTMGSGPDGAYEVPLHLAGLEVGMYAPREIDLQSPHDRDEIYVIAAGKGEFLCGKTRTSFAPGDVFFVPIGMEHRFENFSDDFYTWVIFQERKAADGEDQPRVDAKNTEPLA
ncbi:MAG: cupin domain-containing protein [Sphingomonadales bacterium]